MGKFGVAIVFVVCIFAWGRTISAHHGTGLAYDTKNPITLKGTVTLYEWANPHIKIYFNVMDNKGAVKNWSCETMSPSRLAKRGWTMDSMKSGSAITVTLDPSRTGQPSGFVVRIILADGTVLTTADEPPDLR
jgi:hypothetical protein